MIFRKNKRGFSRSKRGFGQSVWSFSDKNRASLDEYGGLGVLGFWCWGFGALLMKLKIIFPIKFNFFHTFIGKYCHFL